jgi:hypothetical protein
VEENHFRNVLSMLFLNGIVMFGARKGTAALGCVTVFFYETGGATAPTDFFIIKIQLFLEVQVP